MSNQKSNRVALIAISILFTSAVFSLAHAQSVPYTFEEGQPAMANEVNANFAALSDLVTEANSRIEDVASCIRCRSSEFAVDQQRLSRGDRIDINGVRYTIVEAEVPNFDTDEVWLLRFPTSDRLFGGNGAQNFIRVEVYGPNPNRPIEMRQADYVTYLNGLRTTVRDVSTYGVQVFGLNHNSSMSVFSRYNQITTLEIELGPQTIISLELQGRGQSEHESERSVSSRLGNRVEGLVPDSSSRSMYWLEHNQLLQYVWLERR